MGALDIWALPTRRTIWARAVSDPTRVALSCSAPQLVLSQIKLVMTKAETGMQAPGGAAALLRSSLLHGAANITVDCTGLTWQ